MKRVALIDYGMGNLHSAHKGFLREGITVDFVESPDGLKDADAVILPGVGHFGAAMKELEKRNLIDPLRRFALSNRPFLGVCLGLQLLFDSSEESPGVAGLGLLKGVVKRFSLPTEYKIPHMGWNQLHIKKPSRLLANVPEGAHAYFVHSYYAAPSESSVIAAESDYGGRFCAVVEHGNIMAAQFHPEKSQAVGRRIIDNFSQLVLQGATL